MKESQFIWYSGQVLRNRC